MNLLFEVLFGGLELPGGAFSISLDIISGSTPFQISSSQSELELQQSLWFSSSVLFRSPYSLSLVEYAASDFGKSVGYIEDRNFRTDNLCFTSHKVLLRVMLMKKNKQTNERQH